MLLKIRGNLDRPNLTSNIQDELAKLELIRGIDLITPADLFDLDIQRYLERCRQRASVEAPHALRRHLNEARLIWLAAFVYIASLQPDRRFGGLVDQNYSPDQCTSRTQDIEETTGRHQERICVSGKQNLLFNLASVTLCSTGWRGA